MGKAPKMFNRTFTALLKEAEFTSEMLGAGATQIRKANYASKGIYFQAFTSLSTGVERVGKICLMLDHYVERKGTFPDSDYMQKEIGHNIASIYEKSAALIPKYSISMSFLQSLDGPIYQAILSILSEFALGDRYSNVNLLVGGGRQNDPVTAWFKRVDLPIFQDRVPQKRKDKIKTNARVIDAALGGISLVRHVSELNEDVTDVYTASRMTGVYRAVAPYRQLYVLQIIRYWVELIWHLQHAAMAVESESGKEDIPYLSEIFRGFYNQDAYLRSRKTWNNI